MNGATRASLTEQVGLCSVSATLADYLASTGQRKWQYGALDCCTFMSDWLVTNGLPDPMADRRGLYSTRQQYRRLIRSEGGIVYACSKRFSEIGLSETDDPKAGDVALVLVPFAVRRTGPLISQAIGSVCVSGTMRAIVSSDRALTIAPIATIKVWSLYA